MQPAGSNGPPWSKTAVDPQTVCHSFDSNSQLQSQEVGEEESLSVEVLKALHILEGDKVTQELINCLDPETLRGIFRNLFRKFNSLEKQHEEFKTDTSQKLQDAQSEILVSKEEIYKQILDALERDFNCTICHEIFIQPVVLANCGHTFCNHCIGRWKLEGRGNPNCPICGKSSLRQLTTHNGMDNFIKNVHSNLLSQEISNRRKEVIREREQVIETLKNKQQPYVPLMWVMVAPQHLRDPTSNPTRESHRLGRIASPISPPASVVADHHRRDDYREAPVRLPGFSSFRNQSNASVSVVPSSPRLIPNLRPYTPDTYISDGSLIYAPDRYQIHANHPGVQDDLENTELLNIRTEMETDRRSEGGMGNFRRTSRTLAIVPPSVTSNHTDQNPREQVQTVIPHHDYDRRHTRLTSRVSYVVHRIGDRMSSPPRRVLRRTFPRTQYGFRESRDYQEELENRQHVNIRTASIGSFDSGHVPRRQARSSGNNSLPRATPALGVSASSIATRASQFSDTLESIMRSATPYNDPRP